MIDRRPGPEKLAGDQDQLQLVMEALAGLPEVDRAAVLMRADEGLAYEEIAVALGVCRLRQGEGPPRTVEAGRAAACRQPLDGNGGTIP